MKTSERMTRTKAHGERVLFSLFLVLMGVSFIALALAWAQI